MTTKTFHFTSPSNQHIVIDDKYTYRDIVTIEDLKFLFSLKNRLYTTDMFELAFNNNILNLSTRLDDLHINTFEIIHIYKPKPVDDEMCEQETASPESAVTIQPQEPTQAPDTIEHLSDIPTNKCIIF
jgi:hypothetical protein